MITETFMDSNYTTYTYKNSRIDKGKVVLGSIKSICPSCKNALEKPREHGVEVTCTCGAQMIRYGNCLTVSIKEV
jgi:predicted RNA-binding Zn-ribbon protein involved in translation (DUF1610 family)